MSDVTGKIMGGVIVLCGLIAGAAMYYLQIYAFYEEVVPNGADDVVLLASDGAAQTITYAEFQAIDSDSSPIRYRACFTTDAAREALLETYQVFERPVPRVAPGWFDCFDAEAIAKELKAGTATAFLSGKNVRYGVDRVTAITDDGRGYVWHELNNCGEKAYDGTVIGESCPPLEDFQ